MYTCHLILTFPDNSMRSHIFNIGHATTVVVYDAARKDMA